MLQIAFALEAVRAQNRILEPPRLVSQPLDRGAQNREFIPLRVAYSQQIADDQDRRSESSKEYDIKEIAHRLEAVEASIVTAQNAEKQWASKALMEIPSSETNLQDVSKEPWTHKVGGSVFFDYVGFVGQDNNFKSIYGDPQDYSEIRRARIDVAGKGWGVYEYKLELDFSPEMKTTVYDESAGDTWQTDAFPFTSVNKAWIAMHDVPHLQFLRIGQEKARMGLEQLTSRSNITFMERSLATDLFTPSYKIGLQQSGLYLNDQVLFENGVFFGHNYRTTREKVDNRQGLVWASRTAWAPICYDEGRSLLHFGAGWSHSADRDVSFNLRPLTHESVETLKPGTIALDHFNVGNLEMAATSGRFSIQSEMFAGSYQEVNGQSFNAYGAYVTGSMFLTNDFRPYKRSAGTFSSVKPTTNFWLVDTDCGVNAGSGAWQLAARWDYIDLTDVPLDEDDIGGLENNLTLGLNWYWTPNARVMFEYIHACPFTEKEGIIPGTESEVDILGMRFQLVF